MTEEEFNQKINELLAPLQEAVKSWPPELKTKVRKYFEMLAEKIGSLTNEEIADMLFKAYVENKKRKNLPAVKSKRTKNHVSPKDRLTRVIFGLDDKVNLQELLNPEGVSLRTDAKGKISIVASVFFEGLSDEKLQAKLDNRFTRAVCDSVTSLILAGNEYITPEHIAMALNGYSRERRKTSDKFIEQIKESVEILRFTRCRIDATNEANARGYNFQETHFDGYLAPMDALEVVLMNGQRVKAYRVLREPILHKYARQKGQVLTVDVDMLALPEHINMTQENIILQRYLIEEIERMKNPKSKRSCVMKYETIYKALNATELSRTEKKRIRDAVKKFLDYWIDMAYMKGYQEEIENTTITGVFIKLYEHEKQ